MALLYLGSTGTIAEHAYHMWDQDRQQIAAISRHLRRVDRRLLRQESLRHRVHSTLAQADATLERLSDSYDDELARIDTLERELKDGVRDRMVLGLIDPTTASDVYRYAHRPPGSEDPRRPIECSEIRE